MNRRTLFRVAIALLAGVVGLFAGRYVGTEVLNNDDDEAVSNVQVNTNDDSGYLGGYIAPPLEIADFTVASTAGEDFTLSEDKGEVTLIYFGYMTCPDFCPTTMAELQRVYTELTEQEQAAIKVIFFTVDPERDTLERMERYVAAFNEAFIGLHPGDESAMIPITGDFGVVAAKREVDSALEYLVDHTASVFMLDANGNLMNRFAYETPYLDIVHDVRLALEDSES